MLSQETKAKRHGTMIRMDKDLHRRLAEVANRETRTVNQQIIYYVTRGLEQDGCHDSDVTTAAPM